MPLPDHVALKYFFLGRLDILEPLSAITAPGGDVELLDITSSFEQNLRSLTSSASLPFTMAAASVSTRYQIHDSIIELKYTDGADPSFDAKVVHRVKQRLDSQEGKVELARRVFDELESARHDESFRMACAELLLQSVVLTWSTFEVLVSDVFVLLLNRNPKFATELMRDDRTKKWFQPKELVTMLPDYSYDLSNRMGEILIGWHRLDDIRAMRSVFGVLFPAGSVLQKGLQEKALWLLNQRRNLIVHRRAVVDRAYAENSGDTVALGTRLAIEPDYLESSVDLVRDVGMEVLRAAMQLSPVVP
jgi:hypothetical protein